MQPRLSGNAERLQASGGAMWKISDTLHASICGVERSWRKHKADGASRRESNCLRRAYTSFAAATAAAVLELDDRARPAVAPARRAREARSSAGSNSPSGRSARPLPLNAPRPAPISMPNRSNSALRTAASSTPAGIRTALSCGSSWPACVAYSMPIAARPALSACVILAMPCEATLRALPPAPAAALRAARTSC